VKADVLTVPTRSVLQHEDRSFVFVADSDASNGDASNGDAATGDAGNGDNRFRRVDVETGDDGEDRIEIVAGLKAGDQVVTNGAFILKSELLLEGEDE
jgi:cobalt-zinc-cadmium efflux system membrane fusion protein